MAFNLPRAIAFGLLTRYGPRVSLLGLAIAAGALATLSLAFTQSQYP